MPTSAGAFIDLGITYLRTAKLDEALGQFEAGLNVPFPSPPTPDWRGAIAGLNQALVTTPDRADAHNVLGLLLGRDGAASTEVAAQFREAIRLRPDYAEAHNNLGLVLIQSGQDEAGIAALREAVRLAPNVCGGPGQPRRGAHADRRRCRHSRAGAGGRAGARLGESAVQSGRRLRRQPERRRRKGNRASAQGDRARADVWARTPRARQSAAAGRPGSRSD